MKIPAWVPPLKSRRAIIGYLVTILLGWGHDIWRVIIAIIRWAGDVEFVGSNWSQIDHFLQTGWGTLVSFIIGGAIVASAVWRGQGRPQADVDPTASPGANAATIPTSMGIGDEIAALIQERTEIQQQRRQRESEAARTTTPLRSQSLQLSIKRLTKQEEILTRRIDELRGHGN